MLACPLKQACRPHETAPRTVFLTGSAGFSPKLRLDQVKNQGDLSFPEDAGQCQAATHTQPRQTCSHLSKCPPANDGQGLKVCCTQALALQAGEVPLPLLKGSQAVLPLLLRQLLPLQLTLKAVTPAAEDQGFETQFVCIAS